MVIFSTPITDPHPQLYLFNIKIYIFTFFFKNNLLCAILIQNQYSDFSSITVNNGAS